MGAVWSALLVGGGLAGALFVWLLRGDPGHTGNEAVAELKEAPPGETAAPEGDQGGGGRLSSEPSGQDPVAKPDHLQESNGRLISETKGLDNKGNLQETAQRLQSPSGEDGDCDSSRQHGSSGQSLDTKLLATSETGHSRGYSQVTSNISLDPTGEWKFQKGQETPAKAATCFAEKVPSSNLLMDRTQQVNVRFQVHYITNTGEQFIAVTGDHESLGRWHTYIPLQYSKDGFWSHSVSLPANTVVQWKFVVVENGEVTRWEECSNRFLDTGHEDKVVQEWWGSH